MSPPRVVLDTNIIISALLFGGKPRQILQFVIERRLHSVTSPALLSELSEILAKKFLFPKNKLLMVERKVKKISSVVYPSEIITILRDKPDNRVLETAHTGECGYVITGDKQLLKLRVFRDIGIVTPEQFLRTFVP